MEDKQNKPQHTPSGSGSGGGPDGELHHEHRRSLPLLDRAPAIPEPIVGDIHRVALPALGHHKPRVARRAVLSAASLMKRLRKKTQRELLHYS